LYDWLAKNLEPENQATLQPVKKYRKWEIWNMITELKKRKNFYAIDIMAAQYGHKIIRYVNDFLQ